MQQNNNSDHSTVLGCLAAPLFAVGTRLFVFAESLRGALAAVGVLELVAYVAADRGRAGCCAAGGLLCGDEDGQRHHVEQDKSKVHSFKIFFFLCFLIKLFLHKNL